MAKLRHVRHRPRRQSGSGSKVSRSTGMPPWSVLSRTGSAGKPQSAAAAPRRRWPALQRCAAGRSAGVMPWLPSWLAVRLRKCVMPVCAHRHGATWYPFVCLSDKLSAAIVWLAVISRRPLTHMS